MRNDRVESTSTNDWRRLHALGLPAGSVRAVLAVLIFATTWGLLIVRPWAEIPDYLGDLLFIIMGHYFASRRRVEHVEEPGPPPLYLPRGSIRVLLIGGCVAVALILLRRGALTRLDTNRGVVTLLLVAGFLIGVMLNALNQWWQDRGHVPSRIVEDVRALVALAAALALIALVWNRVVAVVPPDRIEQITTRWIHLGRFGPEHMLAAVVGFYFGSRS